jgi:predicted dehydrogenase
MENKIIRVGLAGYGLGGRCFHAPFIAADPRYELVRVLERHHAHSKDHYPGVLVTRTIDELVGDPTIDLIVVTTPNETHYPYARLALEAGKHVVVDKPMTVTAADATALIDLAQQKGKMLSVYQNRRYASDAITIRNLIRQGLLGTLVEFEAQYNRYRPELKNSWKETDVPGSGLLYDLGPHIIDQALTLFGLPKAISADIRRQRPGTQADDYFDLRLDYGFLKVILKAGMYVREQGPRYQIHGTRGSFIKYGDDPQDNDARAGMLPSDPAWGMEPASQFGLLHTEIDGQVIKKQIPSEKGDFGIYYRQLYDTLVYGAPLCEKPEHGYNVVKLIELATESNRVKCTIPVEGLMHAGYTLA